MTSAACPDTFRFVSTDVTGKTHVVFLFLFLSSEPDFFRVDDDDEITGVHVRRENRFSFPAQQVCSLHRDAAEHLVLGVDDPPLARHIAGFGRKCFHGRKKSTETTGNGSGCQPMRRAGLWDHWLNARWRTLLCALNSLPMSNAIPKTAISPRRDEDFPEWYQQVIQAAELAEPSDVRGCM